MEIKPVFDSEITKHFQGLASDFKFGIRHVRADEIQLYNDKCIVRFIYDGGRVLCDFTDPEEKRLKEMIVRKDGMPSGFPVYSAYSVWKLRQTLRSLPPPS